MSDTESDSLRYDRMVENALRSVVRQALEEVIDHGLPGDHHFYITFLTEYPGVDIPEYLKERYPGEMTIVLQYQFKDLYVDDEIMAVTLSFNNVPEKLTVPMAAISIFADPSVNFALQFQPMDEAAGPAEDLGLPGDIEEMGEEEPKKSGDDDEAKGEVVSLDQFRKKKD